MFVQALCDQRSGSCLYPFPDSLSCVCVCYVVQWAHALHHYVVNIDYRPEEQMVRNSKHTTHKHAFCSPV